MARCGFMLVALVAVIIAVLFQKASALKCWECKENQSDCRDPFRSEGAVGKVNQEQCEVDPKDSVVCVKEKKPTGEVQRECSTKKLATVRCTSETNECEICETDLCNSGIQYGPVAISIAIPVIIAKILSL